MTEPVIKNEMKKGKKTVCIKRTRTLAYLKASIQKSYGDYDSDNVIATAYRLMFLDFNDDDDDDD